MTASGGNSRRSLVECLEARTLLFGAAEGTITKLADFTQATAAMFGPGDIVVDDQGNLSGGYVIGSSGHGGGYRLPQGTHTILPLITNAPANLPDAFDLIMGPDGNLYGVSTAGNADYPGGTVFKIVKDSNTVTVLSGFKSGVNGTQPNTIIMDDNGDIYGLSAGGASAYDGGIFKLPHGSNTVTRLATLNLPSTTFPHRLVIDKNGDLYGIANSNSSFSGSVFKLAKGSSQVETLVDMSANGGPREPMGLAIDPEGNLIISVRFYPMSNGAILQLPHGSKTPIVLATFPTAANEANIPHWITLDSKGNIFGTSEGYPSTVFELPVGQNAIHTLAYITGGDGAIGWDLTLDKNGTIFGAALQGGANNLGTLFKVTYPAAIGSISGTAWNDKNSNGVNDNGESPLANWTVYLDRNNNNVLDSTDTATKTDAAGHYTFSDLANGNYHVKQVISSGFRKTLPVAPVQGYDVTITADDAAITAKDFRNTTNILVGGTVFHDFNSNGIQDAEDFGLDGVTINIISNGQIIATRTTNEFGFWRVQGLAAGSGSVEVVPPGVFFPTLPQNGKYFGSMSAGERNQNLNFGMTEPAAPVPANFHPILTIASFDKSIEEKFDLLAPISE